MDNWLSFYAAGCGLSFSVLGAWGLLSSFHGSGRVGPAGGPTSESSGLEANRRAFLRMKRLSGVFWSCLGVATLGISSSTHDSWGLPTLALLWAAMVHFLGCRLGASPRVVSRPREPGGRLAEIVTQHVERAFKQGGHIGMVVGVIARDEEVLLGFGARQVGDLQLGLALGAIAEDEGMLLKYGARPLGDPRPPDEDTVFEIGSVSKVFTGLLLARRVEDGELELDGRIAGLLPEGWSLSESARGITLRHCTTHTSGLPRLPANLLGVSDVLRLAFLGRDPYRGYSQARFREALATAGLVSDPGTEHRYSNFAVGLLGFVLATRDGTNYETLVRSEICEPLGMHRTVITSGQWQREHMAAKYRSVAKLGPLRLAFEGDEWRFPDHLAGAGGIRSTGRDMMIFLKANMGLVPTPIDGAIRRSHRGLFRADADEGMGMNWIRSSGPDPSRNILWHNGGTGGFSTYLGFTENRRFGVFVLSNTATSVDSLARGIFGALAREYPS